MLCLKVPSYMMKRIKKYIQQTLSICRQTKIRVFITLTLALLTFLYFKGDHSQTEAEQIKRLVESGFLSALEKKQVTFYRYQDWCKVLHYKREQYASDHRTTCTLSQTPSRPMDSESTRTLHSILASATTSGLDILMATATFESKPPHRIARVEIEVGCGWNCYVIYLYSLKPLHETPTKDMPRRVQRNIFPHWAVIYDN